MVKTLGAAVRVSGAGVHVFEHVCRKKGGHIKHVDLIEHPVVVRVQDRPESLHSAEPDVSRQALSVATQRVYVGKASLAVVEYMP